ncbi:hypothetical protein E4O93_19295 [Diaphorobacter sp. DS2]|nr:hypothetical protein E4O93_19295 [Diaphorobacter sp. DS2]
MRCLLKEAYSTSCGSSGTGETPQTRSVEEAHRLPRGLLSILERKSTGNIDRLITIIKENKLLIEFTENIKIIYNIENYNNIIFWGILI